MRKGGDELKITQHTCPRDCFDACSILAYVNESGRLVKVNGDKKHHYTNGKLCCKGYAYTEYVYHPDRLTYPMIQTPRFSGNWERISWEDAVNRICNKIIKIEEEFGNFLPIAYMKGGGSYGLLAESMRGLFTSLGPISIVNTAGALCLATAWDAQMLDFGNFISPLPHEMGKADTVILWGVNPVETAVHQIPLLEKVRARGGKIILIDIYPSKSSIIADSFIRVKPGGDGALALSILKQLMIHNTVAVNLKEKYSGGQEFYNWLMETESAILDEVSGVDPTDIAKLAEEIANQKSVAFWLGMGMQRYSNGGQNIRNIHALAVASGHIGNPGGGIYFPRIDHWKFNYKFDSYSKKNGGENRIIGVNALAENISNCNEPPLKMLWITSCNPLVRCTDIKELRSKMKKLDLIVTVDHFLTSTAQASDIVLPATTCFESWDLVASYWHHWVGINQPAIKPVEECLSELQMAKLISKRLNKIKPDITPFPSEMNDEDWISEEISPWLSEKLKITSYQDLLNRPHSLSNIEENQFNSRNLQYKLMNPEALWQGSPELPILVAPKDPPKTYPFRFVLLHRLETLNSQLTNMEWLETDQTDLLLFLSPKIAKAKGIHSGQKIVAYNHIGEVRLIARVKNSLPDDVVFCYSMYDLNGETVNVLTGIQETDLGRIMYKYPGVAYHDTFVNLVRV